MTKVLLVEDDKSLREIYGVRLLAEGYDIVSAGDGEAALAMAIKDRPQLIVSDVMMPKISGFDMLDILRSTTETKDIKVIMMTALSSDDQRARGEALGADRYLVKSQVGIEDVVRTVHEVLGDAPVASSSAASFAPSAPPAAPMPTATPRPAPTAVPPRPTGTESTPPAAPSFSSPQPSNPTPQPPVAPAPTTAPTPPASTPDAHPPVPPAAPAPSSSAASSLPQPTAPFSTSRPANLGDRIIHPITPPQDKKDIGSLIDQELNGVPPVAPPPAPNPPAPVEPTSTQPPAPAPNPQPSSDTSSPQPAGPDSAPPTPAPTPGASGISFEETPRTASPQPAPFTAGPQPPHAS